MNNIIATIFSSLYQQIVLIASCLFILQLPLEKWRNRRTLITFFLSWIPIFLIQNFNNNWVLPSLFLLLGIFSLALHIITGCRYFHALLSICISYFIMLLLNMPFLFVCYLLWDPQLILGSAWLSFGIAVISSVFQYLVIRHLPVRRLFKSLCRIPISISYFILLFLAVLALLCSLNTEITYIPHFVKNFLIVFLILISGLVFTQQILINRRSTMELHYYEQYLPVLDNLIQKVRETQHGHNNTIQAILHLIDVDSDNEKISEALSNYTNELQESLLPPSLLRLENKLLAALLYHKHCQAAEQGMTIHFHIADPMCCCRASEFELVDAVGILVDNALEASSPGDNIYVSIHASHHNGTEGIKIVVDNPGETVNDAFREQILKRGYTTKTVEAEKHGLGLSILQNIVKKHNGALMISNALHDELQYISFTLLL